MYNLVTKPRYFDKPTLASVKQSWEWMRNHAKHHYVTCIAMPRIACGLDGLEWLQVKEMLVDVFHTTNITIQVFCL